MAVTLSCGDNGALGPPISVLTQPGLTKTQVKPVPNSMPATATDTAGLAVNCCAKEMGGDVQLVGPPRGKSWSDQFGEFN